MLQRKMKIKSGSGYSILTTVLLFLRTLYSQIPQVAMLDYEVRIPEQTSQSVLWEDLLMHDAEWYSSNKAICIADNILIYQRGSGGWPKNIEYNQPITEVKKKDLTEYIDEPLATIDNGATYTQMWFLARVYKQTHDQCYVLAFLKGLDYLLHAQYDNGGWPQYFPLRNGYYSQITYNDDAMIGVMRLLRDIAANQIEFNFVDEDRRLMAQLAVRKGIECILKTQVVVDGQLTAWCAQHDVQTLEPVKARVYEHLSLSGKETVSIVWLLMEIENPSSEIIAAIQGAIAWLDQVRINGIKRIWKPDSRSPTGYDKIVIKDPEASSIWARFYLIGSNRPFFSDRDGKIYYDLSEISMERRNKYGWLGYWPQEILDRFYPQWHARWATGTNVLKH